MLSTLCVMIAVAVPQTPEQRMEELIRKASGQDLPSGMVRDQDVHPALKELSERYMLEKLPQEKIRYYIESYEREQKAKALGVRGLESEITYIPNFYHKGDPIPYLLNLYQKGAPIPYMPNFFQLSSPTQYLPLVGVRRDEQLLKDVWDRFEERLNVEQRKSVDKHP